MFDSPLLLFGAVTGDYSLGHRAGACERTLNSSSTNSSSSICSKLVASIIVLLLSFLQ